VPQEQRQRGAMPFAIVVKLSPTSVDVAATCLMRYDHLYLKRDLTSPPSPASQRGITVHRVLASYNWHAMRDGALPDPETFIGSLWSGALAANPEVETARDYIAACVRGYARYLHFWRLRVLHAEELAPMPARPLATNPDIAVAISGKPDVILESTETTGLAERGALLTWDIKTSSSLPLAPELRLKPSTLLYRMLTAYQHPHAGRILVGQMLPQTGEDVWVELTRAEMEAEQQHIRDIVERIATANFPATKNDGCWSCPVYQANGCPAHEQQGVGDEF